MPVLQKCLLRAVFVQPLLCALNDPLNNVPVWHEVMFKYELGGNIMSMPAFTVAKADITLHIVDMCTLLSDKMSVLTR